MSLVGFQKDTYALSANVLSDTDNDSSDDEPITRRPAPPSSLQGPPKPVVLSGVSDLADLERMASLALDLSGGNGAPRVLGCRGNSRLLGSTPVRGPRNCTTLCCEPDCSCTDCPECVDRCLIVQSKRHRHRHRHPFLRDVELYTGPTGLGPIEPTPQYLAAAKVKSKSEPSDHPLVIVSLVGVLCAKLPFHLSGGHTNVLSRTYLDPFIDYLLHPGNRWSVAFWTGSMKRKEALEVLRILKLPTGSAEKDERDGVVGVWSKEDTRAGYDGGKLNVKDLQVIWDELDEEEGIRWTQEDTVVITDFPGYMKAQPFNYIIAPSFHYRMLTSAWDDQYLLMLIACLKDLETETNFCQVIQEENWGNEDTWSSEIQKDQDYRDKLVHIATRVCAKQRIVIKASGGN